MKYRVYYKNYPHSKLATFINGLQSSFWGAVSFASIPALPFMVLSINLDLQWLMWIFAIILIGGTYFIMKINTDKLARTIYLNKHKNKIFDALENMLKDLSDEYSISILDQEITAYAKKIYDRLVQEYEKNLDDIIKPMLFDFLTSKGIILDADEETDSN